MNDKFKTQAQKDADRKPTESNTRTPYKASGNKAPQTAALGNDEQMSTPANQS